VFIKDEVQGAGIETTVEVKGLDLSGEYVLEIFFRPGLPNPIQSSLIENWRIP